MSETISPKHLWREAGIAGIVLGGVSIAYSLITMIIPAGVGGVMGNLMLSILRFAIWAAKFIGCIMLVKYFMKKLVAKYDEVDVLLLCRIERQYAFFIPYQRDAFVRDLFGLCLAGRILEDIQHLDRRDQSSVRFLLRQTDGGFQSKDTGHSLVQTFRRDNAVRITLLHEFEVFGKRPLEQEHIRSISDAQRDRFGPRYFFSEADHRGGIGDDNAIESQLAAQ